MKYLLIMFFLLASTQTFAESFNSMMSAVGRGQVSELTIGEVQNFHQAIGAQTYDFQYHNLMQSIAPKPGRGNATQIIQRGRFINQFGNQIEVDKIQYFYVPKDGRIPEDEE